MHVVENRLEDGEFMKFNVELYAKNGYYFQMPKWRHSHGAREHRTKVIYQLIALIGQFFEDGILANTIYTNIMQYFR